MEEQNLPLEETPLNGTPAEESTPSAPEESVESAPETAEPQDTLPAEMTQTATPAPAPIKKKKIKTGRVLSILALSLTVLSLAANAFFFWVLYTHTDGILLPGASVPQSQTPSYNYRDEVSADDELTTQEIIRKINPSVVTITSTFSNQGQAARAIGTGIIFTDNGYILTNAHVIEGAVEVSVTDYNGKVYPATLIGADSESETGILKIDGTNLPAVEFGKSSELVPGDRVIAIGTPYIAGLHHTATEGIVSAHRSDVVFSSMGGPADMIQHDASINSGNSGGPLINAYGQVVGINTLKIYGDYENLGFALAIDSILPIAEQLMAEGKVSRPAIGITGYTYQTAELSGTYVESVVQDGPADKAGLQRGDVIIKVGDVPISTIDELKAEIRKNKIGDSVSITYMRGETVHTTVMILAELQ